MKNKFKADFSLILVTIAWGASFILTKNVLKELSTFNFLSVRFFLAFALSWVIFFKEMIKTDKKTFRNSVVLGILMFGAFSFQTMGLNFTSASKSAFITGINVVMVPVISAVFLKEKPDLKTVIAVMGAFVGLGMLTMDGGITAINIGDIYTFISAILFALSIIMLGKYTRESKSVPLAVYQFGVVSLLASLTSFLFEDFTVSISRPAIANIMILVVFCTIGAYVVQSVAQRYTSSTHTALIFTGEPVFAGIFGYLLLGEVLGGMKLLGAVIIVFSMLFSEVSIKDIINYRKMKVGREAR